MNRFELPPILYLGVAAAAIVTTIAVLLWWYRGTSRKRATIEEPASAAPDSAALLAPLDDAAVLTPLDDWATFAPPEEAPPAAAPAAPSAVALPGPTKMTFHLRLPTQGQARSAGQIARREGYVAEVRPPVDGDTHWLCLLTRELIPTPEGVEEERVYLEELAAGFGGSIERWEPVP